MSSDGPTACALCLRRLVESVPAVNRAFCINCVRTLGDVATNPTWLARLWRPMPPPPPMGAKELQVALGEFWDEFGIAGMSFQAPPNDHSSEIHLLLAAAYRDMGLADHALQEFASALRATPRPTVSQASQAIAGILEPGLLRMDVDEALSTIRAEYFVN